MKVFFNKFAQFTKTRLILSGWYALILFLILLAFSVVLSVTYDNDVTRIVLKQDFGNHVPRILSKVELRLVLAQVRELRSTSRLDIIIIDLITIFIGAVLSYFLAGKTLQPIQKNMEGQKLFIADASHELKSPVTTIQSACEVVLRSPKKTKEDYRKVVEQVHEQSLRLGRLINDLLSLSVLDTGKGKLLKVCSLSHTVEKEVEAIMPVLKKSKLILEKSIEPKVFINGDIGKLQQLIVILLDNAVKFTPVDGKVTVKVISKPQPQIIVKDTGVGIAPEEQGAIFTRFYQADDSHIGSGAGLGLAIAQSIMKLHKGKISVISDLGSGSAFTCTFPKSNV